MAFSEELAKRIRKALEGRRRLEEKKMFGGLVFLFHGNMCCGVMGDELMVRVGPGFYEKALAFRHVRPMDFTGKPLRGFAYVTAEGIASDSDLASWLKRGVDFALSLPKKEKRNAGVRDRT